MILRFSSKRLIGLMLLITVAFPAGLFAQDLPVLTKAFTIKFRQVDEVASLINSLVSEKGAVTLQPRLRTIIVQDYEKNLRQIEMAISGFDVPPPAAEVTVKLVRASRSPKEVPIAEEIKNMARVGEVLKFNDYSLLDTGLVQCQEGAASILTLAKDYQLSFVADIIQEGNRIIRLKDFQLKKRRKDAAGKETFQPLITVTVNLRDGETLVLGASRFEDSDQALLVVLMGKVKK